MITFDCGVCQAKLQVPPSQAGQRVRCPKCQSAVVAPGEPTSIAPAVGTVAPRGRRYGFNCVFCSSRLEASESMAGSKGECPTCGNEIVVPSLDRQGRLIDPLTGQVVKPDPHPVHAYAAAGTRAPRLLRKPDGTRAIGCPRCPAVNPITANNCSACGMPFTIEGTQVDPTAGGSGMGVASLVLGIIGIFTFCFPLISVIGLILGLVAMAQLSKSQTTSGRGIAWAGISTSLLGIMVFVVFWLVQ